METNIITITNVVFVVSTNPVPVTLAGLDFNSASTLYMDGFNHGFPIAASVGLLWLVYRSLRTPHFPSGSD
jgi:hypothetical protein